MQDLKELKGKLSEWKVLIVDDEDDLRRSIEQIFESFFAEVVSAVDGKDALEKFNQQGPFDMIITDISMPNITGTELVKEIRSVTKDVFIVIMSGAFDDYKDELNKDDVLVNKPFTFNETIELFASLVEFKNNS